jgi:hypothetical protein
MAPLIPLAVASLGGLAFWQVKRRRYGKMTDERKKIFEAALNGKTGIKDPVKLTKLAEAFEKEGLKAQGTELRKRARLKSAPKEVKAKYDATFRKALSSTDPQKVASAAQAFHKVGAYGAAAKLQKYGQNLTPRAPSSVSYGDAPQGPGGLPPKVTPAAAMAADRAKKVA